MHSQKKQAMAGLTLAALGVVYGDIGTSPLYTLKECFLGQNLTTTTANILGILSLIFWSLIFIVSIKYITFVMHADNRGEGGVMALMALAGRYLRQKSRWRIIILGLLGASLFYGDAIITPAISVLSAAEGLMVASTSLSHYVLPMALIVLIALFFLQRFGTASVGMLFGPVMGLWFLCIGLLGIPHIIDKPSVLFAINPYYAFRFIAENGWGTLLLLGSVVLALTGAEALYADMGHFGSSPIRRAWFSLVLPGLGLNYFGQGALLMQTPAAIRNPFYLLAPEWALLPMIILATLATVIASQAVISGAYSLTQQAIQLGFFPRMEVQHTSDREIGQIYLPFINWALLVAVIIVIMSFQSSSNLAAAYGIAVTGTMLITTSLFFVVARLNWHWPLYRVLFITGIFAIIDIAFFIGNLHKLTDGGWLPLVLGIAIFILMSTWKRGRALLLDKTRKKELPLEGFIANLEAYPPTRVEGTAVFLTGNTQGVPHALLHNLKHNKVLHERVVFLTIQTDDVPYVPDNERLSITRLSPSFWRVVTHYGFKEEPNISQIMALCGKNDLPFEIMDTSFFLSRETLVPSHDPEMSVPRQKLFVWMSKNAMLATDFFQIPANRVVELGSQIEL